MVQLTGSGSVPFGLIILNGLPHPLVLLRGGEDLCLADEDVAEGTAAAALLVEAGDGAHGERFDH